MSDNPRVNVIRQVLEQDLIETTGPIREELRAITRQVLEDDAEAILAALDRHDDDLVASMPRAHPDAVVVRLEVTLPDSLQSDRTKQKNGARILIDPEQVTPSLAANVGPIIEAVMAVAVRAVRIGVRP